MKADVVIISFSFNLPTSLENVKEKLVLEVRHQCKVASIILLGNEIKLQAAAMWKHG